MAPARTEQCLPSQVLTKGEGGSGATAAVLLCDNLLVHLILLPSSFGFSYARIVLLG